MADWSSVFEETGEEDGDWNRCETEVSRISILASFHNYSPLVAYFFTVNYVLGVGCLGIPYAFLKSGLLLASFIIIIVTLVSYITVMFIAEVSYKGINIKFQRNPQNPFLSAKKKSPSNSTISDLLIAAASKLSYQAISQKDNKDGTNKASTPHRSIESKNLLSRPRFDSNDSTADFDEYHGEMEVTELVDEYLGPIGKAVYQIALGMLSFIGLLAYAQVFNDSFRLQVWPNCPSIAPLVLFGIVVVPLSCIDLVEQISVQVAMSIFRFMSLGLLLFGTLAAVWLSPLDRPSQSQQTSKMDASQPPVPLIETSGFALIFTTAIFSQLFQHSVPGLMRPLDPGGKRKVPTIFAGALITTALLYIAIGCCCAFYFGDETKQSINLNFVGFNWGIDRATHPEWLVCMVSAASLIVAIFPALDTLSVFPLIANTLGNNLYAAVPRTKKYLKQMKVFGTDKVKLRFAAKVFWRLVASIPPIIGSGFITELSLSLQLAGICGIVVALVTPAFLYKSMIGGLNSFSDLFSMKLIGSSELLLLSTPYSTRFSQPLWSSLVLLVALLALAICIWQIISPQR